MTTQSDTIGGTSTNSGPGANVLVGCVITPTQSGTLQNIGVNVYTAAGNVRAGAYSNYSGVFSGLLSQSSNTPVSGTGWLYMPVSPANVTQGVPIYLSLQRDNASFSAYAIASGTLYYVNQTYGAFPDPTGSLTPVTYTFNMSITYTVATPPTPTPTLNPAPYVPSTSVAVQAVQQFINLMRGGLTGPHNHSAAQGGPITTDQPITVTNGLQPALNCRTQVLNQNFNSDLWRGHRYYVQPSQPSPKTLPVNKGDLWFDGGTFWQWIGSKWVNPTSGAVFSVEGTMLTPVTGTTISLWRAAFPCTLTGVWGYQDVGTGSVFNAQKITAGGVTQSHLPSGAVTLKSNAWTPGGSVLNTSYSVGDQVQIVIGSGAGSPTMIGVQVDFTRT